MADLWKNFAGQYPPGALVYFFEANTNTPMTVYADALETTPLTHPVQAFANGRFPPIFVPYRTYRERVTDQYGVLLWDIDGIPNPAPPSSGGGSGIVVTQDMVLQTGMVVWELRGGTKPGFVRMNGRSIGNPSSGATERANADTEGLFTYLWNNLDNDIAPVPGGRGATAAADFAANKTIVVPTMQGLIAGGVDDMGAAAANRLQIAATISTTNNDNEITVNSVAGLGIGMYVIANGIPAGTTITDISGTTVTLSANATATASGVNARFSWIPDAQKLGVLGGAASHVQHGKEVGQHDHPVNVNDPGHQHSYSGVVSSYGISSAIGPNQVPVGGGTLTSSSPTGITVSVGDYTDGGLPMPTLPPTRLGTFYMKL